MDELANELLQKLKALRADIASMRTDAAAHHQKTAAAIDALYTELNIINVRIYYLSGARSGPPNVAELVRRIMAGD
jgi:hypothetical protein